MYMYMYMYMYIYNIAIFTHSIKALTNNELNKNYVFKFLQ